MIDRRKEWTTIAKKFKKGFDIQVKAHRFLKSFYIKGTVDCEKLSEYLWGEEVVPEKPFEYLDAPVLIECWLSEDDSWDHWHDIKNKYLSVDGLNRSRERFIEIIKHHFPTNGESFFNGKEEQLYNLFFSMGRFNRNDHPRFKDEDVFLRLVPKYFTNLTCGFLFVLDSDPPNPFHVGRFRVKEWEDLFSTMSQIKGYHWPFMSQLVRYVDIILSNPKDFPQINVGLCESILQALNNNKNIAPLKELLSEMANYKLTKTEKLFLGGDVKLYVICKDAHKATILKDALSFEKLINYEKDENINGKEVGYLNSLTTQSHKNGSLINRNPANRLIDVLENSFIADFKLGPRGGQQIHSLLSTLRYLGVPTTFAYIENTFSKGIYYKLTYGFKHSNNLEIIPIYKIGTDKATDEKISQLTPNNAPVLPYIVDKYDEVPKDFSDEIDLENEYVVFTGKLNGGTRYDIEKFAKKLGANVQKSLNSKTTLLVVGEKPGPSKVSKAKQLGIKIINEAEYSDLVEKQIKSYEERREKNSTNEIVNVRSY
jgi:hypothetical protein